MEESFLYYTVFPVLLGDARSAGRVARDIYCRHGRESHWIGYGFSLYTAIYARRQSLPAGECYGSLTVRRLLDLAKEQRHGSALLCLIPCCEEAEAFLTEVREALEDRYVILPLPTRGCDPLSPLVLAR